MNIVHVHAFSEHFDQTEGFHLLGDALWQFAFQILTLIILHNLPLRLLNEHPQPPYVEGLLFVHIRGISPIVFVGGGRLVGYIGLTVCRTLLASTTHQGFFYEGLEGLFVGFRYVHRYI